MREYLYFLVIDKRKGFIASIIKSILFIFSLLYAVTVIILVFIYRFKPHRLNCKVISVGNITWGGTGKTPLVEMLARRLTRSGHRVAILSRGYKRVYSSQFTVHSSDFKDMGDEPYLLKKNLPEVPILIGANRLKTGREAVEKYNVDTIILDDGFQYWGLYRDLEIVVIDSTNPFGNGKLIPRGILREPKTSLKRADLFFLTKVDLGRHNLVEIKKVLKKINPDASIIESIHQTVGFYRLKDKETKKEILAPSFVSKKDICVVSSIGNPEAFLKCLSNLGANIILRFTFLDHHSYTKDDLKNIIETCLKYKISTIVTTEKDSVRLPCSLYPTPLYLDFLILCIEIKILQDEKGFFNRVDSLYQC